MEKQDRDWSLTPQQAPTAAKRLGKRVQRRLKSAVRRIRHPKSGGDGVGSDGTSDGSSGDDEASDSDSEASAQTVQERLQRLPSPRRRAVTASPAGAATGAHAGGKTLAVQVLMARGLPASDLNGLADPYCSVLCGSEEGLTAPVFNTLEPRWSETFVFANSGATREAWPHRQRVVITVKDSNKHLPDDYLGKVEASLARFTESPAPQWLDLRRPKGGVADKGESCGQICIAMWLGPELMPQPQGNGERPVVSSLCFPVGACKQLPSVLHSQKHALYEEPSMVYLDVILDQLRIMDGEALLLPDQKRRSHKKQRRFNVPAQHASFERFQQTTAQRPMPDGQSLAEEAQPAFAPGNSDTSSSGATVAPDAESNDEGDDEDEDQGGGGMDFSSIADPFGDQDSKGSKDSKGSGSHGSKHGGGEPSPHGGTQHGSDKQSDRRDQAEVDQDDGQSWLFVKVILSDQQHKSSMKLLQGDSVRWRNHFPFVAIAPLRHQLVEVQLFRAVADRSRGRLVGSALIPLIDLMTSANIGEPGLEAAEISSKGKLSFEMHQQGKQGAMCAAVRLGLDAVDADDRRQLYRQPLFDLQEPSSGPKHSSLVSAQGGHADPALALAATVPRPLPSVTQPPLGMLSLTLSHIELAEPAHAFAVISCGPHWGLTPVVPETHEPWFNWQVHLPIHDVYTLFQLGIFRSGEGEQIASVKRRTPFLKSKPLLLGKLRVRLSTVVPGKTWTVALPMLSGRRNGGERTATAHLSMRVDYRSRKDQLAAYSKPPMQRKAYTSAISALANNKEMNIKGRDMVSTWLEAAQPSMPKSVADSMADDARDEFSLPRAHVNFRRCSEALNGFKRLGALYQHAKSWRNPLLSLWVHALAWLMCFRTTLFVLLCIGGTLYHVARRADPEKGAPEPMDEDPTGLKSEGGDEDEDRQKSLSLKIKVKGKYDKLLQVCLRFSNGLDDVACFFERWQTALNWSDPTATMVCVCLLVLLGTSCAVFGFPTTLCTILFIMLRHPILRSPTPPAPLNFFMRLPTRSDLIM